MFRYGGEMGTEDIISFIFLSYLIEKLPFPKTKVLSKKSYLQY